VVKIFERLEYSFWAGLLLPSLCDHITLQGGPDKLTGVGAKMTPSLWNKTETTPLPEAPIRGKPGLFVDVR
jgi:hypothetical protein